MVAPARTGRTRRSRLERNLSSKEALEKAKREARANNQEYASRPLDDEVTYTRKTEEAQARYWAAWQMYFREVEELDPDKIWYDLCEDVDVSAPIRSFFKFYITNSEAERLVLGPEERVMKRCMESTKSVLGIWKTLRGAAEMNLLREKRRLERDRAHIYYVNGIPGLREDGPVVAIKNWIRGSLTDELGLSREQQFEKKEATDEDIMIILNVLWQRADCIHAEPSVRHAFHCVVLLLGIGGFRPGVVLGSKASDGLKYGDVDLMLVRDGSAAKLVVTIAIKHNKRETNAVYENQSNRLTFSVTLVPCKLICLASFLVARALRDDAFDVAFNNLDHLLKQPEFEHVDVIRLPWKDTIRSQPIAPISYFTFLKVWHRAVLVAGLRDSSQRPYSLRVGAGGRLDGSLEPSVRNYILSNTSRIYETSYLPRHLRQDLVKLAFGRERAGDGENLFGMLQNSFLCRDDRAPIYPTEARLASFEQRQDLSALRREHQLAKEADPKGPSGAEPLRLRAKIGWLIRSLSDLAVKEDRMQYFADADKLRAEGRSTFGLLPVNQSAPMEARPKGWRAAMKIGHFFAPSDTKKEEIEDHDWRDSVNLVDILVPYLKGNAQQAEILIDDAQPMTAASRPKLLDIFDDKRPCRCLFGCQAYAYRHGLTRHNTAAHYEKGQFDKAFECPECLRVGLGACTINGVVHWSNHVETIHGRNLAPMPPPAARHGLGSSALAKSRCHICDVEVTQGSCFAQHWDKHVKAGLFDKTFPCPDCFRERQISVMIDGAAAWHAHLVDQHQGGGPVGKFQDPGRNLTKRGPRRSETWGRPRKRHKTSTFVDQSQPADFSMTTPTTSASSASMASPPKSSPESEERDVVLQPLGGVSLDSEDLEWDVSDWEGFSDEEPIPKAAFDESNMQRDDSPQSPHFSLRLLDPRLRLERC